MSINKFEFYTTEEAFPNITSGTSNIPEWYKGAAPLKPIKRLPVTDGMKACMPFLDSFLTGYQIPLHLDIAVEQINGNPIITWRRGDLKAVDVRERNESSTMPIPHGCSPIEFLWYHQTWIRVPKGYSILAIHPLNRFDLPFVTGSAVIDADSVFGPGNVPFFLKEGFEGVIPMGTPIMQVVPFKRESWEAKETKSVFIDGQKFRNKSVLKGRGFYKNNLWHKKEYK